MNQHYFDIPFAFSGDKTAIPDPLQVGGTVSMTEGWNYNYQRNLATDPAALPIDRSTTNWLFEQITQAIQAIQQNGVPEFILASQNGGTAYSYGQGAIVLWSASGNAPFGKYVSLTAGNTNTPSASDPQGLTTGWQIEVDPIATVAQAAAGTNDASIMTPLKVAQQTVLRALLAGSSSQVFNVGSAVSATQAVQLQQMQAVQGNYRNAIALNTNTTLTATQMSGNAIEWFGSSGGILTLASAASLTTGQLCKIYNYGAGTLVVNTSGISGDFIYNGLSATLTTITLQRGDDIEFVARGSQEIDMCGGTAIRQYYPLLSAGLSGMGADIVAPNVFANVAGGATTVNFTADQSIVKTALGGTSYSRANLNATLNLAGTPGAANSMDTGTATANGWLGVYHIYNPTTNTDALYGTMEPSAAKLTNIYNGATGLPAGYTASRLIGILPISSTTGQFAGSTVVDRMVYVARGVAFTTTSTSNITSLNTCALSTTSTPYSAREIFGDISGSTTAAVGTSLTFAVSPSTATANGEIFPTYLNVGQTYYRIPVFTPRSAAYLLTQTAAGTMSFQINTAGFTF